MDVLRLLTPERVRRYPLLLLVVTVGLYGVRLARSDHWIEPDGRIVGQDYFAFYMAGDCVARGRTSQLYDAAAQSEYQRAWMRDVNPQWRGTCLYLNPPHYAWLLSWPARLGYGGSLLVWWAASLAAFGVTVRLWRSWLPPDAWGTAVLLAVCMPAWFAALAGGQNSFFSLLVLTGFCALLMKGRDGWAGLVLSLLGFKFQLLLVPAGLLLWKRRWRALGGVALGGGLTLGLTVLTTGFESLHAYLAFSGEIARLMHADGFDVWKQHSWRGFFALLGGKWCPSAWMTAAAIAACLASLAVLLRLWRGPWRPGSPAFALRLSALIMATLLTSPHLFHYDMLLAVLPVVLWAAAGEARHRSAFVAIAALGFAWLALGGPAGAMLRVQLSPLLMAGWLLLAERTVRGLSDSVTTAKCGNSEAAAILAS